MPKWLASSYQRSRAAFGPLTAVAAGALATLYFYRGFFSSSLGLVQGNFFDGRLTQTFALHWLDPLQFGSVINLGIFYPFDRGLMYSDTFLLFGLASAPISWLGSTGSIAFQLSLIFVTGLGYSSLVTVLRIFRLSWPLTIAAALLTIFSNGMLIASAHPQLIALYFIPTVWLLALVALRTQDSFRQLALSAAATALFGFTLYTAFYIGWMIILASTTCALITFLLWPREMRMRMKGRFTRFHVVGSAIGLFVPVLATLYTYVPLLQSGTERSLDDVSSFALKPKDLFGVSPTNVVWSPLFNRLFAPVSDEEFAMSPTPGLILTGALVAVWAIRSSSRSDARVGLGLAMSVTGFVLWLLPVRWGSFFPWSLVYEIPGASAIRAIGRIEIAAGLFLVVGTAILLSTLKLPESRRAIVLITLVIGFLLVEQINTRVQQKVDVVAITNLQQLASPRLQCSTFFIAPPFDASRIYENQADPVIDSAIGVGITAQIIAQATGIPSLNGYSGGAPTDWPLAPSTIVDPDVYIRVLDSFIADNGINDVCAFDLKDLTWTTYSPSGN